MEKNSTYKIIEAAIEVHRTLGGPGLLESVYESALCKELALKGLRFRRQVPVPVVYKGLRKENPIICMVGDGINDAPALTAAHIGISVVSAADTSIQVSDLLLTTNDLTVISKIRALSSFTRRIINQNLFWAFFYNALGMALAAFGFLTPIFSAAAMVLSSAIVLFNARRIYRKS